MRKNKPTWPLSREGLCLTELLIACTAGVVVLSAALQALDHFQGRLWNQIRTMDAQQEVRIGLKILADELHLAGTGASLSQAPLVTAEPQQIRFLANLDAFFTILTAPALPDASELTVANGHDWPNGKRVLVCEYARCREGRLSRVGQGHSLSLADPLHQPFASGHPVIVSNVVRYYLGENRAGQPTLMREVDGGANPLIANLSTLHFQYLDADGRPTADISRVTRVRVELALARGRLITTEVHVGGRL